MNHAATYTYAVRLKSGEYIATPEWPRATTVSLHEARIWIWPMRDDHSAEIAKVREVMPWVPDGARSQRWRP